MRAEGGGVLGGVPRVWEGPWESRVVSGGVMEGNATGGLRSLRRAERTEEERETVGSPAGGLHLGDEGGWLPLRLKFDFLSCTPS